MLHRLRIQNAAMRGIEDRVFTARRLRLYGTVIPAAYALVLGMFALRGVWLVNPDGTSRATDFVAMWAAGAQVLHGDAAGAYGLSALAGIEARTVGEFSGLYPWPYPPPFLFAAIALALVPYVMAFLAWMAVTLSAYLAALYAILPERLVFALGLALPAALTNVVAGQNGFLTAALLGGSLALLERRPITAGLCLGLLTYKPQFGLLFPLVLLLTGRWRAFAAAAAMALALAGASALAFGTGTWQAFIRSAPGHAAAVMAEGGIDWWKLQSVYGLIRWLGGGATLAWTGHSAVALATALFVGLIWRRPIAYSLKAAAASLGALIVTPYLFGYDLAALAVPIAFLVQGGLASGFIRGERTAILGVSILPLLDWLEPLPAGQITEAVLMSLIVLHVRREAAAASPAAALPASLSPQAAADGAHPP